jgi:hypothetical protein
LLYDITVYIFFVSLNLILKILLSFACILLLIKGYFSRNFLSFIDLDQSNIDLGPLLDIVLEIPLDLNLHQPRFMRSGPVSDAQWGMVPELISDAIFGVLGPQIPIDPSMPYVYVQAGVMPHYVVSYFMDIQKPSRASYETRFGRAMHLIEDFREWRLGQSGAFETDETAIGPVGPPILGTVQPDEGKVSPGPQDAEDAGLSTDTEAGPSQAGPSQAGPSQAGPSQAGSEAEDKDGKKKRKKKTWALASKEEQDQCKQQ